MRILVVGASGMIGSTVLKVLSEKQEWEVFGTVRNGGIRKFFRPEISRNIISGVELYNQDQLVDVFSTIRPDVLINCAGLTKHRPEADDPLSCITLNSVVPHRLLELCVLSGTRMIHVSTDCVFLGEKGGYKETDVTDAGDVYGRSKALGELLSEQALTVRISTIGRELNTKHGLLEWFLSQEDECSGFRKAVFSGLPTSVFAEVVRDYIIPDTRLSGLYHIAAAPINKYDLLLMLADAYKKKIRINPNDDFVIDRSLDGSRFVAATGYSAPEWPDLIHQMQSQPIN